MPVTLQQIADAAGVSRGTVDRALNHRGRIRPEVAENIQQIAKDMGYQPSLAGRALVMSKKKFKIGMIIHSIDTPFMQELAEGAEDARSEVESLGTTVDIFRVNGVDVDEISDLMQKMIEENYSGIALAGADDSGLRKLVNQCVDQYHIPVITFNGDMPDTKRLSYVGQDTRQSGRVAAGLMGELITGGAVAVIAETRTNAGVNSRIEGFSEIIQQNCPNAKIMETKYAYGDNWVSEQLTNVLLVENPELTGIYVAASGAAGVCKSLEEQGVSEKIKVIAHDDLEENVRWLKKGAINFIIGQEAHTQGYNPIKLLFNQLMDQGDPIEDVNYDNIYIKTKYNV